MNTNRILGNYDYKDIEYVSTCSDIPGGIVISHGGFQRLHMFQCEDRDNLIKSIVDFSFNYIGSSVRIKKEQFLYDIFLNEKYGKYR